jgi:hypothetical protein
MRSSYQFKLGSSKPFERQERGVYAASTLANPPAVSLSLQFQISNM